MQTETDEAESHKPSFLKEKHVILSIVNKVGSDITISDFDRDFANLSSILLIYQEQSYLLNPFLSDILQPLNCGLVKIVQETDSSQV